MILGPTTLVGNLTLRKDYPSTSYCEDIVTVDHLVTCIRIMTDDIEKIKKIVLTMPENWAIPFLKEFNFDAKFLCKLWERKISSINNVYSPEDLEVFSYLLRSTNRLRYISKYEAISRTFLEKRFDKALESILFIINERRKELPNSVDFILYGDEENE